MPVSAVRATPDACVVDLPDDAATQAFGARFAAALTTLVDGAPPRFPGLDVHLRGDLGAGKTTLVRAVLRALGHPGRVRSPTYTLVEPYALDCAAGPPTVYHFDLYRFADPAEWIDAGFRDYFGAGALCLVEWPERAAGLLPPADLILTLEVAGDGRRLTAHACSDHGRACLARC